MKSVTMKSKQQGLMLLEVLIGLLIFSMGILGVIGLQAATISGTMDAKYRSDAAFLASQILAQMWADQGTNQVNLANYHCPTGCLSTSSNANVANWVKQIEGAAGVRAWLPGVTDANGNAPTINVAAVTINGVVVNNEKLVTVTVNWQAPQGKRMVHSYTAVGQISQQ